MKLPAFLTAVLSLSLASCASTPNVTVGYHHARALAALSVTRTFACNKKNNHVVEVVSTDFQPKYVADRTWVPFVVKSVDGTMANTDLTFSYYDDGRLKSVNSETTGQAGEILKSAVTAVTSIATIFGLDGGGSAPEACKEIDVVGDGKPLAITYKTLLDPTKEGVIDVIEVPVASGSEANHVALEKFIGPVCATIISGPKPIKSVPTIDPADVSPTLALIQPGTATVEVRTRNCEGKALASHEMIAPQFGQPFRMPIPKAKAFGKQTFALELAESGMITKVQYARDTGANQGLTVLNTALPAFKGSTAEERANAANDKADEIAANARLARCLTDPDNCE